MCMLSHAIQTNLFIWILIIWIKFELDLKTVKHNITWLQFWLYLYLQINSMLTGPVLRPYL